MRYISHIPNLIIYKDNGGIGHGWDRGVTPYSPMKKEYRFGPTGVLALGTLTTDVGYGNYIDAASNSYYPDAKLQYIYDTDLSGATANVVERAGQGALNTKASSGTLGTLDWGYRGIFFPAPPMSSPHTSSLVTDATYQVLSGEVTFNGVTYTAPDRFEASLSTGTLDTGTFALGIPRELCPDSCDSFRTEEFKIKSLKVGDEPNDYWAYNQGHDFGGFDEKDSLTSADTDYFGWVR